ncbi:DUF3012 domain-containing protein [Parahaliea maris]|uniref:DUF3012 domain-containing protein n=1 Tax=Parahaliea maris TaxID=2716870 RepID=A0A5C8ZZM9_9GAMM|nr:DUF3012 domain-containing protein [Parahaliea maris]TXS93956.1 DUF3012 domain-containing protein [Parahaliea maris]
MRNWRVLLLAGGLSLAGCSNEPGSEGWCEDKKAQSKSEWTADDAVTFASHCVFEGTTVGSEAWCEALAEKPKGDWSSNEAADYAKHCVF